MLEAALINIFVLTMDQMTACNKETDAQDNKAMKF